MKKITMGRALNLFQKLVGLLFLVCVPGVVAAITTETGKSFFAPPSLSSMLEPVNMHTQLFVGQTDPAQKFTLSLSPFYLKSTNGSDLRHYFFPEGKDELVIKGAAAPAGAYDISGTWLKIAGRNGVDEFSLLENAFQSTFQVTPIYEYLGVNATLHKDLGKFWIEVSLPIAQASVNHGIREFNLGGNFDSIDDVPLFDMPTAGAGVYVENPSILYNVNATQAFTQPLWRNHRLSSTSLKKYGVGDTTLKVGIGGELGSLFAQFILPTAQKPTNAFMFEPTLGNRGHFGLGVGGNFTLATDRSGFIDRMGIVGSADYAYLFSGRENRTFDTTVYGPFSRYLLFKVATLDGFGTGKLPWHPGVDVLTKECDVTPQGVVHAGVKGFIQHKALQFTLGYNLLFEQQESIKIREGFSQPYGAAHAANYAGLTTSGFLAQPTIKAHAQDQPALLAADPHVISTEDLDIGAATRPSQVTSSLSAGALGSSSWHGSNVQYGITGGLNLNHERTSLRSWFLALHYSINL